MEHPTKLSCVLAGKCFLNRICTERRSPEMCVCCSSELNWCTVVNMLMSLFKRFANSSKRRKTVRSSISKGCSKLEQATHSLRG